MLEITIIGNVGSLRFVQAGETEVLNISVAASRKIGEREFTDWVSAKIWGERARKLEPFIQKGAKLLFRGRPEAKAFQRNNGTVAGELVVHVADLEFLSGKPKSHAEELPLEAATSPASRPKKKKSDAA